MIKICKICGKIMKIKYEGMLKDPFYDIDACEKCNTQAEF